MTSQILLRVETFYPKNVIQTVVTLKQTVRYMDIIIGMPNMMNCNRHDKVDFKQIQEVKLK